MSFEHVHRSKSQSPQSSSSTSQFAPRPFSGQEPKRLPTQEDIENEAFQQNKFEAFGLQLKEKHGTITPVEQERLGVLQAKMDGFWAQRMERAKAQPNLLEILIRNSQATQTTESQAPVQSNTIQAKGDITGDRPDSSLGRRPNETGMPDALKAGVESLSGYSLDNVRIHYNSPKPAQLQANAYTQGTEIHVAPGQERYLPHEAWHVVQQAQGRVQPTMQMKGGVPINDDEGLEHEADVMGANALAIATRLTTGPKEKLLQSKFDPDAVGADLVKTESPANGTGLSDNLKASVESLSDMSLDNVKVHYNSAQRALTQSVAQLKPEKKAVSGITHLVKMKDGSIYNEDFVGTEVMEVETGDVVQIETDVKYWSRRGPNQETYSQKDKTGPSIYKWFQVLSVNNFPVEKDVFIRDDTFQAISEAEARGGPWLLFGCNGKDEKALTDAVSNGYRRFDCAEGYGNTELVAQVLRNKELKRRDYEIVYKFEIRSGDKNLLKRLMGALNLFEGRIDSLLIHNIEGSAEDIKHAWEVLNHLKTMGAVREIGLGNIKPQHAHLIEELEKTGKVDTIENSVASVLADKDLQQLIKSTGARVIFYDVLKTAEEIGVNTPKGIKALVFHMASVHQQSQMILSSSNAERQAENLKHHAYGQFEEDFSGGEQYEDLGKIDTWQRGANRCPTSDMQFTLPPKVAEFLFSLVSGNTEVVRQKITVASPNMIVTPQSLTEWLTTNTEVVPGDLNIRVPNRKGLKKRYLGMPLIVILSSLFGAKNCDWKWAIELIQAMVANAADWDAFGMAACQEVVERSE